MILPSLSVSIQSCYSVIQEEGEILHAWCFKYHPCLQTVSLIIRVIRLPSGQKRELQQEITIETYRQDCSPPV